MAAPRSYVPDFKPFRAVTFSTPGGYTTNARFAIAHGLTDFVGGVAITPTLIEVQEAAVDEYETQTITITGTPTGGTFTLTFNGNTTAGIAYNASAANVKTALIGTGMGLATGDVNTTGGALPGTPVVVDFSPGIVHGTFPALMTADGSGLTGGSSPAVTPSVSHTISSHVSTAVIGADETNVYLRASGALTNAVLLVA